MTENKDREVLVIPRNKLFDLMKYFQGFSETFSPGLIQKIESNAIWINKRIAEENPFYKQIIGYTVVIHPYEEKIFAYQRFHKSFFNPEKRPPGKYSIAIGGHIEKHNDYKSIIFSSIERRLNKTFNIQFDFSSLELIGFINDDTNEVGKAHIGLLFHCLGHTEIQTRNLEIELGSFESISKIDEINRNGELETWSSISLPFIKNLIS